jgi:ABC-2 type transport system permease protein
VRGIPAVFYRDYRQRITNLGFLFWDLFVPVAYLLLFGTGFQRAVGEEFILNEVTIGYSAFFLPGVVAMTAFSIAMNTSWSFFMDKDSGIFFELLTYPITRRQLLIGKICFNVLLSLMGSFLTILLAVILLGVEIHWNLLPLTALAVVITTAGWFFFFSIFAIRIRRMDSFNTFTSACYIILMFISTMFYPIVGMPAWFRAIAWLNPMTWQVDILRYSILGAGSLATILAEAAAFFAFLIVGLNFAVRTIDRTA